VLEMELQRLWDFIEQYIFTLPSEAMGQRPAFNPYCDEYPAYDLPGAAEIRRENLYAYLRSLSRQPEVLIVGEALGWRGCRFSGVPLTCEAQLLSGKLPFGGRQSSRSARPYAEATATIFWHTMLPYFPGFMSWNCVPIHTHTTGKPLTNRRPTRQEISDYQPFLQELVGLIAPRTVIALGKAAEAALILSGISYYPVRHPSHGGRQGFRMGIEEAASGGCFSKNG